MFLVQHLGRVHWDWVQQWFGAKTETPRYYLHPLRGIKHNSQKEMHKVRDKEMQEIGWLTNTVKWYSCLKFDQLAPATLNSAVPAAVALYVMV